MERVQAITANRDESAHDRDCVHTLGEIWACPGCQRAPSVFQSPFDG